MILIDNSVVAMRKKLKTVEYKDLYHISKKQTTDVDTEQGCAAYGQRAEID